jgi:Uncharacterized protein conserved in bacteria (DUF2147)
MKKMFVIAAFLLASSAAQAQYSFEYGGRTIRIDPDRGTVSIPGVYDNTGRKSKRTHGDQDSDRPRKQTPEQAKIDPQTPATDPAPAPAPAPAAQTPAPANTLPDPPAATASSTPSDTITSAQPSANLPPPQVQQDAAPAPRPAPPPVVATAPPAAPEPRPVSPVQAANSNSPLGVWLTEEKEGKVRIEQCGANLCGYSVDLKSNQNGEQVLIDMKPGKDKWSGRINDLKSGSTYDSTIALKSSDSLRVQGCAFGGMFCGGQTWSRVN